MLYNQTIVKITPIIENPLMISINIFMYIIFGIINIILLFKTFIYNKNKINISIILSFIPNIISYIIENIFNIYINNKIYNYNNILLNNSYLLTNNSYLLTNNSYLLTNNIGEIKSYSFNIVKMVIHIYNSVYLTLLILNLYLVSQIKYDTINFIINYCIISNLHIFNLLIYYSNLYIFYCIKNEYINNGYFEYIYIKNESNNIHIILNIYYIIIGLLLFTKIIRIPFNNNYYKSLLSLYIYNDTYLMGYVSSQYLLLNDTIDKQSNTIITKKVNNICCLLNKKLCIYSFLCILFSINELYIVFTYTIYFTISILFSIKINDNFYTPLVCTFNSIITFLIIVNSFSFSFFRYIYNKCINKNICINNIIFFKCCYEKIHIICYIIASIFKFVTLIYVYIWCKYLFNIEGYGSNPKTNKTMVDDFTYINMNNINNIKINYLYELCYNFSQGIFNY